MLFGSPLRAAISRSGSASPDDRNAESSCAECTTDLTRYGSRPLSMGRIIVKRFASRNGPIEMQNGSALLRLHGLVKSYAGVRALKGVSFELRTGEVHALVGENGAGKSTLIKVITGAIAPDEGTIEIGGRVVPRMDPHAAHLAGIAAVYQQPALFPHLSVAENIALQQERGRGRRVIDWRAREAHARGLLARVGSHLDPRRTIDTLAMPDQQMVEIARALGSDARIVIMDEPTASLGEREVESLFRAVALLKAGGAGVIYISHRLEEIAALADRVTVLRDGESVGAFDAATMTRQELVRLMVGRPVADVYPAREHATGAVRLELEGLGHAESGVRGVTLSVRRGEIVGLAGLVGSGRTELAEIAFGLRPAGEGRIRIDGNDVRIGSPSNAIARGIAYVPEDRRRHGVILDLSIAANASLASLRRVSRHGLIDRALEAAAAARFVDRLRIKTPSVEADVGTLSGGNQQKVALARWLATDPVLLILDEPTQGVDVGAKAEIHRVMAELAASGLAILMISSELPEVLGMSDRIAVMRGGSLAGVLERGEATQQRILALALGHADGGRDPGEVNQ
jgi:rhamnose transport system ATP-binding protein